MLPQFEVFDELNYIGVFLTFRCNLNCAYCINDPAQEGQRCMLNSGEQTLTPEEWARGLARIPATEGLPITLQGGEPLLYFRGKGIGQLVRDLPHKFDLLTNMVVPPGHFLHAIDGQADKLRRDAPYPSIRVSWHETEMKRVWGEELAFRTLLNHCEAITNAGFNVTGNKATSDIGIYVVDHPDNNLTDDMLAMANGRVPVEKKEFLGIHDGKEYGTYLYPYSTSLLQLGVHDRAQKCECRTSELLVDPMGFVWGCHFYLYETWTHTPPNAAFATLKNNSFTFKAMAADLFAHTDIAPVGHILDPAFRLDDIREFRACDHYGQCIGCDTKVKNNRFQSLDDAGKPHTSVEIRNIEPDVGLWSKLDDSDKERFAPFLRKHKD